MILMTAQGTDALAIEALEEGAAGYVPKSQLSRSHDRRNRTGAARRAGEPQLRDCSWAA